MLFSRAGHEPYRKLCGVSRRRLEQNVRARHVTAGDHLNSSARLLASSSSGARRYPNSSCSIRNLRTNASRPIRSCCATWTSSFPMPENDALRMEAIRLGFGSSAEGGRAMGYVIMLKPRYAQERWILAHESARFSRHLLCP